MDILDQLNIHKSETLVRLVAKKCGIDIDLGKKGVKGILKSMETRQKFLENEKKFLENESKRQDVKVYRVF